MCGRQTRFCFYPLLWSAHALLIASATSIPFQTIDKGYYSGFDDAFVHVFKSRPDFDELWRSHSSNDVPDVDFATQIVAVVTMGTQNTGGYGVEITSVDQKEDGELVINFVTSVPSPGAMTTQALTQPYHMISLESTDDNVTFEGPVLLNAVNWDGSGQKTINRSGSRVGGKSNLVLLAGTIFFGCLIRNM